MHNPLDMVVFAKVVELSSFSAAAEHLAMSRSSVSKHVTRLERSLGVRLLTRTTRRLPLTDARHAVFEHCALISREAVGLFDPHITLHYVAGQRTPPKIRACVDVLADYFRDRESAAQFVPAVL